MHSNFDRWQSRLRCGFPDHLDDGLGHTQLGILYARRGEYNRAAAEFELTIKLAPDQATAHYHLGQALIRLGQKEQGDEQLRIFRKLHSQQKDDVVIAFLMTRQDQAK
jgi:Flp pilus assembly protein TadD